MTSTVSASAALDDQDLHRDDLRLVERHRYGDVSAFDELYERYATMVYNLALGLASDPEEAADLTQEIFLRLYRHLAKFRGRSSLKTWVFRVALNHCRSRLARRRNPFVRPLSGGGVLDEQPPRPDPARDPEERASAREERERVAAAIARLPRVFREAVVLRDLQGLAYREVADVLGVRIGTVRSRIARGREQLRDLLENPS